MNLRGKIDTTTFGDEFQILALLAQRSCYTIPKALQELPATPSIGNVIILGPYELPCRLRNRRAVVAAQLTFDNKNTSKGDKNIFNINKRNNNSIMKTNVKDVDIFRDTPVRYLGNATSL